MSANKSFGPAAEGEGCVKVKAAAITPLPWHTDGHYCGYIWSGDKMVADFPMDEDEGTYLARMRGVGRGATHAEQQANAAFIVRAVNCHDQLVAALESARKGFELITTAQSRGLSIHYAEGCAESCMEAAAAALAAAKEGA